MIAPFCVASVGAGYASSAGTDEDTARCEFWLPMWKQPVGVVELCTVFGEGRAQVGGRAARNGVDFAQAAVSHGVDRGISEFYRYAILERNGLSNFATPLGKIPVRRNARVDLLTDISQWHDRLRQKSGPRANPPAPSSISRELNLVERRILELCHEGSRERLQLTIAALGSAERALARSLKWTKESFLRPLSGLRKGWLDQSNDNSVEFRLARSIAGMRAYLGNETSWFRQNLEPVSMGANRDHSWVSWEEIPGNDVAWRDGNIVDALNSIFARRLIQFEKAGARGWPDWSPRPARIEDITAFIEGSVNEELLADLIWGLSLVDWEEIVRDERCNPSAASISEDDDSFVSPSSFYALLRLCFRRSKDNGETIPVNPAILHCAMNGKGEDAAEIAARRLRGSGKAPLVTELPVCGDIARRTAAAVLFPISSRDFRSLEKIILHQPKE